MTSHAYDGVILGLQPLWTRCVRATAVCISRGRTVFEVEVITTTTNIDAVTIHLFRDTIPLDRVTQLVASIPDGSMYSIAIPSIELRAGSYYLSIRCGASPQRFRAVAFKIRGTLTGPGDEVRAQHSRSVKHSRSSLTARNPITHHTRARPAPHSALALCQTLSSQMRPPKPHSHTRHRVFVFERVRVAPALVAWLDHNCGHRILCCAPLTSLLLCVMGCVIQVHGELCPGEFIYHSIQSNFDNSSSVVANNTSPAPGRRLSRFDRMRRLSAGVSTPLQAVCSRRGDFARLHSFVNFDTLPLCTECLSDRQRVRLPGCERAL
jgi:hypothetical protein